MPSHLTHSLFAEEVITSVLGFDYYSRLIKPIAFGAQGPDFFYHNRRTKPSCVMIGAMVHKKQFGSLAANMAELIISKGRDINSTEGAYLAAFTTHAILDRKLHPYINYRAGWGPDYPNCHPFLERIIDVLMLREKKETTPNEIDFYNTVFFGDALPGWLKQLLRDSLLETYPVLQESRNLGIRFENAYTDAMGFYRWIDKVTPEFLRSALKHEKEYPHGRRWLALIHPPFPLPEEIDFMNREHRQWFNPCDKTITDTASGYQLYEDALYEGRKVVEAAVYVLSRTTPPEELESVIGNENLSDEFEGSCRKQFCDPLPLTDVLDFLYREIKTKYG